MTSRIPETMPELIRLYTGAGGLDLGFEAAGFEPVIDRDIHSVSSQELLVQVKTF